MIPAARVSAAVEVLDEILAGSPAEKALTNWARRSRFAGSKDRAAIRDHVFDALRCRRSYAAMGGADTGRGLMTGALRSASGDLDGIFSGIGHAPPAVSEVERAAMRAPRAGGEALDMPDWIFEKLVAQTGEAAAQDICQALRRRAPVWLRVALRRTSRENVIAMLAEDGIVATPHPDVRTALEITENARKIQDSSAYLGGFAELQDAASQAAMLALPLAKPGATALDYCAGGGGKSLALADLGYAVVAHDAAPGRMKDISQRAARAGVRIDVKKNRHDIDGKYDLVLVDAPCSGSGTWRRTPEAKWALTPERLNELCALQKQILTEAAQFVRPGGHLAYATCSVLVVENDVLVSEFMVCNQGFASRRSLDLMPGPLGDGFYLNLMQSV